MSRGTFLIVAVVILAGGCSAGPTQPAESPLHGILFINEFMASNKRTVADEFGDYADWIELYNAGDTSLRLGTMFLTDDLSRPMKWSFPDTFIPAGGFLIVWADAEYRQGALHASFRLNADSGEQLGLYATNGERLFVIDTLSFGPQGADTSMGRVPDGGEWRRLWAPTPGAANSTGESSLAHVLFINEFLASNQTVVADDAGDYDDWIELYNAGSEPIALKGVYLTDDLSQPTKWPFPDVALGPGRFLLVWADNEPAEGPLHATFSLGAAVGEQIGLYQGSGHNVLIVDTLSFGPQAPDTAYGRLPDGGDTWRLLPVPTPSRSNSGRRR